ncbi:hypothetical protein BKA62DRAFT_696142 [Auriculariales sp. MPI-PUGE-AT-0066]|nr:hypothetical protein BKA62DRAFT_696142 [Auriculariales sp. MPI-PUGE-AT-0066]
MVDQDVNPTASSSHRSLDNLHLDEHYQRAGNAESDLGRAGHALKLFKRDQQPLVQNLMSAKAFWQIVNGRVSDLRASVDDATRAIKAEPDSAMTVVLQRQLDAYTEVLQHTERSLAAAAEAVAAAQKSRDIAADLERNRSLAVSEATAELDKLMQQKLEQLQVVTAQAPVDAVEVASEKSASAAPSPAPTAVEEPTEQDTALALLKIKIPELSPPPMPTSPCSGHDTRPLFSPTRPCIVRTPTKPRATRPGEIEVFDDDNNKDVMKRQLTALRKTYLYSDEQGLKRAKDALIQKGTLGVDFPDLRYIFVDFKPADIMALAVHLTLPPYFALKILEIPSRDVRAVVKVVVLVLAARIVTLLPKKSVSRAGKMIVAAVEELNIPDHIWKTYPNLTFSAGLAFLRANILDRPEVGVVKSQVSQELLQSAYRPRDESHSCEYGDREVPPAAWPIPVACGRCTTSCKDAGARHARACYATHQSLDPSCLACLISRKQAECDPSNGCWDKETQAPVKIKGMPGKKRPNDGPPDVGRAAQKPKVRR